MLWGYLHSWLTGKKRMDDPAFRSFLRKYQWACLLRGKKKATELCNQKQQRFWNPEAGIGVNQG
jgi:hypothetical protein